MKTVKYLGVLFFCFYFFSCAQPADKKPTEISLPKVMRAKNIGHKPLKEAMLDPEIKSLVEATVAGQDYSGVNGLYCFLGSTIDLGLWSVGNRLADEETKNKKKAEVKTQCEGCVSQNTFKAAEIPATCNPTLEQFDQCMTYQSNQLAFFKRQYAKLNKDLQCGLLVEDYNLAFSEQDKQEAELLAEKQIACSAFMAGCKPVFADFLNRKSPMSPPPEDKKDEIEIKVDNQEPEAQKEEPKSELK